MAAQLEFPSGRRATISSGYHADNKRIDLWGDQAVAVLDAATSYSGNTLTVTNAGESREVLTGERTSAEQFTGEIDHLSQVIAEGGEVATPGEMGLRDVRIIEALYRSARDCGSWIELAPDGTMRAA